MNKEETLNLLKKARKYYEKMEKHNTRADEIFDYIEKDNKMRQSEITAREKRIKIERKMYLKYKDKYEATLKILIDEPK